MRPARESAVLVAIVLVATVAFAPLTQPAGTATAARGDAPASTAAGVAYEGDRSERGDPARADPGDRPGSAAAVVLSSCTVIDSPGVYELSADVTNATVDTDATLDACIDIQSSDVTVEGNGHAIDGVDTSGTAGVYANGTAAPVSNVTVRNVTVSDWSAGIMYDDAHGGAVGGVAAEGNERGVTFRSADSNGLRNVSAADSDNEGFSFSGSRHNTLTNVSATGNSNEGFELLSGSENNTFANATAADNGFGGFAFSDSGNSTFANVSAVDNSGGFSFRASGNNTFADVSATGNGGSSGFGFLDSGNNTLADVSAAGNRWGFSFSGSGNNTLEGVSATGNSRDGFEFRDSGNNALTAVAARDNGGHGFSLVRSDDAGLEDVNASRNARDGVHLDGSAGVSIRDAVARGNGRWAVFATNVSGAYTARDLATGSATLSLEGRDVALAGVEAPPADPTSPERRNVGQYLDATNNSGAGYLDLVVHYTDASGVNESTLRLWRHDGTAWTEVPGSSVDVAAGEVSANVTAFGVLAPLGEPDATCVAGAVARDDGRISLTEIQRAIDWWADDTPVPGTGGETISLTEIQRFIDAWAGDEAVTCDP